MMAPPPDALRRRAATPPPPSPRADSDNDDAAAAAPTSARSRGPKFMHISLADWALGLAAAVAYIFALRATRLPLAPVELRFDGGGAPLRLWPISAPAGPTPPLARSLLEGRAALLTTPRAGGATSAALLPMPLPLPFMPLPRALRANASIALALTLLRGPAAPAEGLELCVAVEDALGTDITHALMPFAQAPACSGGGNSRRLALKAAAALPPALSAATAAFTLPPGARLASVTLGAADAAGLGGELRLSVAAEGGGDVTIAML